MSLWEVISHFGQLQFFVYLWLVTTFIAWWKNDLTTRRLWLVTLYVGLTMILLVMAIYYRLIVIVGHSTITGMTAAMATYVFMAFVGGLWTAMAVNKLYAKPRGWLFMRITSSIRRFATFLEKHIDVVELLRQTADNMERQAEACDPLHKLQQNLEALQQESNS